MSCCARALLKAWASGRPIWFRIWAPAALTLFAYGSVFALLGVGLKRPLIPGLLFLFVWEGFVANFPGDAPNYTLTAYARSLIRHRPSEEGLAELFSKFFGVGESVLVLGIAGSCVPGSGHMDLFETRVRYLLMRAWELARTGRPCQSICLLQGSFPP